MPTTLRRYSPEFQSAPGGEAGGNASGQRFHRLSCAFQSAPGGEAGGNVMVGGDILYIQNVSIRPRR